MPLFDYACRDCGHRFEFLTRGSARPGCPDCKSRRLDKLFSPFAVGGGRPQPQAPAPCGTCDHPEGPGACRR